MDNPKAVFTGDRNVRFGQPTFQTIDQVHHMRNYLTMEEEATSDHLYQMCLAHIGMAILTCQTVEAVLKTCVDHWFPQNAGMEPDQLDIEKVRFDKATLGRLIKKFAEYEPVPRDFNELLQSVLERRNKLAHNFFEEFVNADDTVRWNIIWDCIELSQDARSCRRTVEKYLLDAQIAAFERTSVADSPLKATSRFWLDELRRKKKRKDS